MLVEVDAAPYADRIVAVHEAAASLAYAHIFSDPFPRAEVRARWAAHRGRVVLAVADETVVGFAAAADATLEGLYVLPQHAGRGIGSTLLEAIAPVSKLWVLEQNAAGRAFYERRGWSWSGTRQSAADAAGKPELLYVAPNSEAGGAK